MKKTIIFVLFIVFVSFIFGAYFYDKMPEQMASHWNFKGEVDGYMPRFLGLFLMPIVSLFMFGLFIFLPKIDPMKKNFEKFRKYYDGFILAIIGFLFYVYLLSLYANLGFEFNMSKMMIPALGVLFYYMGIMVKNAKRNWFVGIRTPWTLSSDKVWDKTHQKAGALFKLLGIIVVLSLFFEEYTMHFVLWPALALVVYLFVYSYVEYKKEKK